MLKVYFSRRFSGFIAIACLLLVVAGGTGLAKAGRTLPMLVQVLGWLIIAAMAWGVIAGFRLFRQPALMYAVTWPGVRIHYDADRILFAEPGVLLPWELVAGMTLEKRNVSPGGTMTWKNFSTDLEYWSIRIGCFLLLSFIDDPAWLAMMFC